MILIGQYDSPFVRRVGIAMRLYGLDFEHRPWSTFRDGDQIVPFNPLKRVPTLGLNDGTSIIESAYILDYLDEQVGEGQALLPARGPERRQALYIIALATGLADKAVSLFYEKALHAQASELWATRCLSQVRGALDRLEALCAEIPGDWFFDRMGHADIALACCVRFAVEAHDGVIDMKAWPHVRRHAARCEALPVFVEISQVFIPPTKG